jgi:hypothetical protein
MATIQIIAIYRPQDIGKARTLRDAIIADGRQAFLTREVGPLRHGDQIVLHAEPPKATLPPVEGGAHV